jgi:hypothetical protein
MRDIFVSMPLQTQSITMLLDYPEYEELKKKSRFLGWLWRVGDLGYYFGLLGGIVWPLAVIQYQITTRTVQLPWEKALLFAALGTARPGD